MPEEIVILKWWSNQPPLLDVLHPLWDTLEKCRADLRFPLRQSLDYHEASVRMAQRCLKKLPS